MAVATKRRCASSSCLTLLSSYNPENICGPCQVRERREAEARAAEASAAEARRERVLAALPGKASEIAWELGLSTKNMHEILRYLFARGVVTRTGSRGRGRGRGHGSVGGYTYHRARDGAEGGP